MTPEQDGRKGRVPAPRLAVLGCPAGAYVGITMAASGPVLEALAVGSGIAALTVAAPSLLKGAAAASRTKTKQAAKPGKGSGPLKKAA